jgi:tripartite-type tricarboxylate transporter receptor subunit TctC
MKRRTFLRLAASTAFLPTAPLVARAQAYPTRPVHMIVGLAAGGPTDVMARIVGQSLSERLGKQFPVENRTGAGGSLATRQ